MEKAGFVKSHQCHAFLSYNTKDIQQVGVVQVALERAGLQLYFAPWDLPPALTLRPELAFRIENLSCFVLFVGPSGIGPYQECEVAHASAHEVPIATVVLRGGDAGAVGRRYSTGTLDCNDAATEYELIDKLIEGITSMTLIREPLQFKSNGNTKLALPGHPPLRLHVLCTIDPENRLMLNWLTLGHLIDNLRTQIKSRPGFRPSAYVGINATGMVVAQFLNNIREPMGFIHTIGAHGTRQIDKRKSWFPKLAQGEKSKILVVDSELKSGSSLELAIRAVKEKYTDAELSYAVLAAMVTKPPVGGGAMKIQAEPLIRGLLNDGSIKKFFIGGTFSDPGFYRPYEIR